MAATRVEAPPTDVPSPGGAGAWTAPAAAALLRRIGEAPQEPLAAVLVGPGGTGKTRLLDDLEHACTAAGVPVVRVSAQAPLPPTWSGTAAVLVDDVHQLDQAGLDRLRVVADDPGSRLVVAHRPWPRPPGLATLFGAAAGRRVVVVVGHLSRDAVAARIAERVGVTPPDAMVDMVHEQSGGLPALVEIVTQALRDTGRFDARHPDTFRRPDLVTVSVALAERLRHQVDGLDHDVRALLEAMAVGASLDGEVLGPLLAGGGTPQTPETLSATVEAARSTGLLTEAGELIPFVRSLVLRLTPVLRRCELQRALAGIELDRGGSVLAAGRQLLGTGASGSRIATVLSAAADEALDTSPALAVDLLADAVKAGADPRLVAGRRARALALAGDLDEALRVGDTVVGDPSAPDQEEAVVAVAAALAHRGLLGRSVDLCAGLPPAAAVRAVPGLVVTGAVDDARALLAAAGSRSGTLLDGAAVKLARGMLATVSASAPAALSQLARAAALLEPVAATVLLPDTPAALTAMVALQCGELSVAQSVLQRALALGHGGRAAQPRHRLLHGWVLMARGRLDLARRALAATTAPLEPRDELLAAALAVALARRAHDPAALAAAWGRARDALVRQPVDLTTLPQLGELAVATAQLGEEGWLAAYLAEADELLERLGRPALWAAPLDWYRLQAALSAGRAADAERIAAELGADPADVAPSPSVTGPYAAVLAAAARCWGHVLDGQVDADEIVAAGRRMQAVGLGWEAAQLVGRAAPLAGDRRVTAGLHAAARALDAAVDDDPVVIDAAEGADVPYPTPTIPAQAVAPADAAPAAIPQADADQPGFTERELEIGQHILAGLTYKQIGQRLYLSAKTVEHHVARMRQRLGVASRDELFGLLRAALDPEAAG